MATLEQLWAWEYKGKTEWGLDDGGYFFTLCYSSSQNYTRDKSQVTNLRKAKVVDAEAVVNLIKLPKMLLRKRGR